jgi:hypothetical protein
MSDENQGAGAPVQQSSAGQTIPKERLDEVLARARLLEEQVRFQQSMIAQLGQRQQIPQQPSAEQERLRRLKEENPELYKSEIQRLRLQQELSQTKQAVAGLWDEQDRIKLLNRYGKNAEKRIQEIEQVLEQFRNNGRYDMNREQVYLLLLGQEQLRKEQAQAAAPPATPAPVVQKEEVDAPPSDARLASSLQGGKAPSGAANKSFQEIEKELEDIPF